MDLFGGEFQQTVNAGGWTCRPIYYKFCDGPKIDNYHISTQLSCPANSSQTGTTCTCNDTYVPDTTQTSCVPEPLTIALGGLGGEVMPTKTLAAYALVTTSSGSPKSGAQVTLILTVKPENGDPILASNVGSVSPNGGSTDSYGKLSFVFTAPVAGGTHTIDAFCTGCTNYAEGTIKVPGCLVKPLTEVKDIPPNDPDVLPLTLRLEDTKGADLALTDAALAGVACIKSKESGAVISSGTRTIAYQKHFIEIWDKMIELNEPDNKNNEACRPLRDRVIAEKGCSMDEGCVGKCIPGSHCIRGEPAINSKHPKGTAFDVSNTTIDSILGKLRPPPPTPPNPPLTPAQQDQADIKLIADWLASPKACNLVWGGSFQDIVHFQIP